MLSHVTGDLSLVLPVTYALFSLSTCVAFKEKERKKCSCLAKPEACNLFSSFFFLYCFKHSQILFYLCNQLLTSFFSSPSLWVLSTEHRKALIALMAIQWLFSEGWVWLCRWMDGWMCTSVHILKTCDHMYFYLFVCYRNLLLTHTCTCSYTVIFAEGARLMKTSRDCSWIKQSQGCLNRGRDVKGKWGVSPGLCLN